MVTVAILTADQRLGFQIHQWMKEMSDSARWDVHTDAAAFVLKIETEIAAENIAGTAGDPDAVTDAEDIGTAKSEQLSDAFIRLVIVDLELLSAKSIDPVDWTRKLKKLMSDRQRSDPAFPVKFLFLAFEGGGFKADHLRDPVIDDLILKPLDRSVFLQKIELMISDEVNMKPTFLFRQKAALTIEIGKEAQVDELSEFAVGIRSPFGLAPGVFASIHADVLGKGEASRVMGRVYKSEKHPSVDGQYLVRFALFGARSQQVTNIKRFMRERQPPPKNRSQASNIPNVDPPVPFNRVAIIDMNTEVYGEIQSALKDHFVGVEVTHYLSYSRLLSNLKKLYKKAPSTDVAVGAGRQPSDGSASTGLDGERDDAAEKVVDPALSKPWTTVGPLIFTMTATEFELLKFETALSSGDSVFGRSRLEWADRPGDLFSSLDKLDFGELREMVDYAVSGGKGRSFLKFKNEIETTFYIEAVATLSRSADRETGAQVQLELVEIEEADYRNAHMQESDKRPSNAGDLLYDAIYVDVNLIRGDLQIWYDGLREAFMMAGVITPLEPMPKIILLADEKSPTRPENYRSKLICDFIFKPLDRKVVSYKAKEIIELIQRKEPELAPFVKCNLPAKLAKEVVTEEVSEYGLSIVHPTPFKAGATMRIFSPLLGGGADGVLARCHYCELRKGEKESTYICNFMFFGTPDEILKRIRTWIREDYINKKEVT